MPALLTLILGIACQQMQTSQDRTRARTPLASCVPGCVQCECLSITFLVPDAARLTQEHATFLDADSVWSGHQRYQHPIG